MDFKRLVSNLKEMHATAEELAFQASTMQVLIAKGEEARIERTADMKVRDWKFKPAPFKGGQITATVDGIAGLYQVRITMSPKRGHQCNCPDWKQRARGVGPCKHVLAVAFYYLEDILGPRLHKLGSYPDEWFLSPGSSMPSEGPGEA